MSKSNQIRRRELSPGRGHEVIKGPWTPEEDQALIKYVEKHGQQNWSRIAKDLGGRVGKQCRERWYNNLSPDIRKDAWTSEEDMTIWKMQNDIGNKWVEIARCLDGRTPNAIKNHWNSKLQKYVLYVCPLSGEEMLVLRSTGKGNSSTKTTRRRQIAPAGKQTVQRAKGVEKKVQGQPYVSPQKNTGMGVFHTTPRGRSRTNPNENGEMGVDGRSSGNLLAPMDYRGLGLPLAREPGLLSFEFENKPHSAPMGRRAMFGNGVGGYGGHESTGRSSCDDSEARYAFGMMPQERKMHDATYFSGNFTPEMESFTYPEGVKGMEGVEGDLYDAFTPSLTMNDEGDLGLDFMSITENQRGYGNGSLVDNHMDDLPMFAGEWNAPLYRAF